VFDSCVAFGKDWLYLYWQTIIVIDFRSTRKPAERPMSSLRQPALLHTSTDSTFAGQISVALTTGDFYGELSRHIRVYLHQRILNGRFTWRPTCVSADRSTAACQIFKEVNGWAGIESREYGRRDPSRWPRDTPLSQIVGTNFADKRRSLC
jgi:hypothetical protein